MPGEAAKRMEKGALGLSTGEHIMAFYRDWLDENRILHSAALAEASRGATVRVAGLMVVRQAPPTAKGIRFITLEDEFGFINVIVRPKIYPDHPPQDQTQAQRGGKDPHRH